VVYTSKGLPVRIYGGKVVENICQAVARQIVAEQMLRVSKRYKVVLTVHDAVAIVAKKEEAAEAQAYLEECMSWNPKWADGLPLSCESGVGASYGDC
jgi:DNA polymerase